MSDGALSGIPHSSNVVTGTRVKFWTSPGWTLGVAAFEIGSPLLILWSAKLFIFSDREFGDLALGAIMLVIGLIGVSMLRGEFRKVVLDSPCPVCGVEGRRTFPDPSKRDTYPPECGSCVAYLRARGREVREEALEGKAGLYLVPPARYASVIARDGAGKFQFAMPAMCGTCGSHNAHELRAIVYVGEHASSGGGVLDSVVSTAVRETVNVGAPTRYSDGLHHPTSAAAEVDAYDAALKGITIFVCPKHTLAASYFDDPIQYWKGELRFKWYAYYRAFLALNKLDGANPPPVSVVAGPPAADQRESPRPQ